MESEEAKIKTWEDGYAVTPAPIYKTFTRKMLKQLTQLAKLGARNVDIAEFFGVHEQTVNLWIKRRPEVVEALRKGKIIADMKVAVSAHRRATGYEYDEIHTVSGTDKEGVPFKMTRTIRRHVPGDTRAQAFWLTNRQRALWSDTSKLEITHNNQDKKKIDVSNLTPEQRDALKALAIEQISSLSGASDN